MPKIRPLQFLWGPNRCGVQECQSEKYPALFIRYFHGLNGSPGTKLIYLRDPHTNEAHEMPNLEVAVQQAKLSLYAKSPIIYIFKDPNYETHSSRHRDDGNDPNRRRDSRRNRNSE